MKNTVLIFAIAIFILACQSRPVARNDSDAETNRKLEEYAASEGITDKELKKSLNSHVIPIVRTQQSMDLRAISEPCVTELKRYCDNTSDVSNTLDCIKSNRDLVSDSCEIGLRYTFGGKPLSEAQLYNGVLLPKGSKFSYNSRDQISGAIAADKLSYKGILFKEGFVRFHNEGIEGIRVATLEFDQIIDGIKYSASGISHSFNKRGEVVSAVLAEDTRIMGQLYKGGTQIGFRSKDVVRTAVLAEDTRIMGQLYKSGTHIWFDSRGVVRGTLEE